MLFLDLLEDCKQLQTISARSILGTIYCSLGHKEEKWGHLSHKIEDLIVRDCWRWASITFILTVNDRTTGNLIRRTMHKVMDIKKSEKKQGRYFEWCPNGCHVFTCRDWSPKLPERKFWQLLFQSKVSLKDNQTSLKGHERRRWEGDSMHIHT